MISVVTSHQPLPVLFSRDLAEVGDDDHRLREGAEARALVRIRRGAYVDAVGWSSAERDARYSTLIAAVRGTRQAGAVLSHHSAARVWGLPVADGWPPQVHLTVLPDSGRRSRNGVVVHRRPLGRGHSVELDGVLVTSLARTLVDLAADAELADAVVALDAAIDRRSPLIDLDAVRSLADDEAMRHASRRVERALDLASEVSESPGESWSRVLMAEAGLPAPVLQHPFVTADGIRLTDFWWPSIGLAGEFDGRGKYRDAPVETVLREKRRENVLRDAGVRVFAR